MKVLIKFQRFCLGIAVLFTGFLLDTRCERTADLVFGMASASALSPSATKLLIAALITASLARPLGNSQSLNRTHDRMAANEMRVNNLGSILGLLAVRLAMRAELCTK